MTLNHDYIKLIFGLKLKRLRQGKKLSLTKLAEKTGLSVSYLNEIESGKKYPKSDKIAQLAKALEVDYDKLVSLKLSNTLAPITDLLESGILEKLPLDHYGIDIRKLITLMSDAPLQLSALIATLIDLAKSSEMSKSVFSRTALRTYKEFNDNYFEDIEKEVDKFRKNHLSLMNETVSYEELENVLKTEFGYTIDTSSLSKKEELMNLRAVMFNGKGKRLLLNSKLSDAQKKFIIGKEIYYCLSAIKERAYIYSDQNLETFDQLLNNFKASYFSTALILNKEFLIPEIKDFFSRDRLQKKLLEDIIKKYGVSPEMLFQRISNLAPKYLGLNKFFFMRFNSFAESDYYSISKELRLNINRNPGGYQSEEHYCRRWISIEILEKLKEKLKTSPNYSRLVIDGIRSVFHKSNDRFLSISIAKPSKLVKGRVTSVTLGFQLDDATKSIIKFWDDKKIKDAVVNDTCEMCEIDDCDRRLVPPTSLQKIKRWENIHAELDRLKSELSPE